MTEYERAQLAQQLMTATMTPTEAGAVLADIISRNCGWIPDDDRQLLADARVALGLSRYA